MTENNDFLLHAQSLVSFNKINNVKFSDREIDILACLINGRSPKGIASLFSLSPRTVETHIRRIMIKIDCHSREGIIKFVEKSPQITSLRKHYQHLLVTLSFDEKLQEISTFSSSTSPSLLLMMKESDKQNKVFCQQLAKHLKVAGITFSMVFYKDKKSFVLPEELFSHLILLFPDSSLKQEPGHPLTKSLFFLPVSSQEELKEMLFLGLDKADTPSLLQRYPQGKWITFNTKERYYQDFFDLLQGILMDPRLDQIKALFQEQSISRQDNPSASEEEKLSLPFKIYAPFLSKSYKFLLGMSLFLIIVSTIIWYGGKNQYLVFFTPQFSIRSDLVIPTPSTLLQRPSLLSSLEKSLNRDQDLQIVAIVGIGGSGKTTLARQYARQQQARIVWEINADTKEELVNSFEHLAQALCISPAEKDRFKEIQEIKKQAEREDNLFLFIKEKLRTYSNWILIYNDVNNFDQIQSYIPHDPAVWGLGKVIITTRDSNIRNNGCVHYTLQMGELSPQEKLTLFTQIIKDDRLKSFPSHQLKEIESFLNKLPSFPLDISIAAYYLKTAHISYDQYLKYLKDYDRDFALIQESILKGVNRYSRTRYSVIALSLKNLTETDKNFEELFLFISLLNAHDIPRGLLDAYKDEVTVDNLIYNLKKYSFLTFDYPTQAHPFPTLSIHKSTHELSLIYFIKTLFLEQNTSSLQKFFQVLEKYIDKIIAEENFSLMKLLLSHCETFLSQPVVRDEGLKASLRGKLGILYFYLGDYKKAQEALEGSLAILEKRLSENTIKLPAILIHLGMVYRKFGDYEKSKNLLEKGLSLYRTHLPTKYAEIAQSLRYLGMIHKSLGNYEKAKELFKESLTIHKDHFSEKHKGFAWSLGSLGVLYRKLGQYNKAKELLEKSLAIYKENFPTNHGGVGWTLAHLGRVHLCLGNYQKAKDLFEESLTIYQTHLSKNNVRISWVLAPLGIVYRELKDYRKAKNMLEQSLEIYGSHLPKDHIAIAWSTAELGIVYKGLGDLDKAKTLLGKSLISYEKHYGKTHFENAYILRELGNLSLLENDIEKAQQLVQDSLDLLVKNHHPEAFISLECLADIYIQKYLQASTEEQAKNLKTQAYQYLDQAFMIVKNQFSPDSIHIKRLALKKEQIKF